MTQIRSDYAVSCGKRLQHGIPRAIVRCRPVHKDEGCTCASVHVGQRIAINIDDIEVGWNRPRNLHLKSPLGYRVRLMRLQYNKSQSSSHGMTWHAEPMLRRTDDVSVGSTCSVAPSP